MTSTNLLGSPSGENQKSSTQQGQKQPDLWGPAPFRKQSDPTAGDYQGSCASPKDREEADLCQQWRAAKAAEENVTLTRAQVPWNVAQTASTIVAAIATVVAAIAAARAAQAATEAIHAERAWVCASGHGSGYFENFTVDNVFVKKGINVAVQWQNAGRSPANNLKSFIEFVVVPANNSTPPWFDDPPDVSEFQTTLAPNHFGSTPPVFIHGADYDALINRTGDLVVFCIATYKDVFIRSLTRTTRLCVIMQYQGDEVDQFGVTRPAFTFMPAGKQTDAT